VWHAGSVRSGLEFAPGPLCAAACSLLAGRLRVPRRWLAVAGSLAFAVAGVLWFVSLDGEVDYAGHYLPALLLSGCGVGLSQASIISAGAATLPPARYATGTGIINTARQIGSAIGVAILVGLLGSGLAPGDYRGAWLLIAICGVLAAVFATAIGDS
jgi:MFS family permease